MRDYLWTNFLGGQNSSEGPLGNALLDGIDLGIKYGGTCYYDVLVKELDSYRKIRRFDLSAAPQCAIPDPYLDNAIETGLMDHVWVLFYNNPWCQYSRWNTQNLIHSWNQWSDLPISKLYLGLPASPDATGRAGGYIPANELLHKILPRIEDTPRYGGVMLWSRYYDVESRYSDKIISGTTGQAFNNVAKI